MDYNKLLLKNTMLEETVQRLTNELNETKEHLKKYTAPKRSKVFYEKHKEEILEKTKDPKVREHRKEINKRAYQKRKEKMQNELENKLQN
jgi:hypothetical protein